METVSVKITINSMEKYVKIFVEMGFSWPLLYLLAMMATLLMETDVLHNVCNKFPTNVQEEVPQLLPHVSTEEFPFLLNFIQ